MKNSKTYITALSICSVLVFSSHSATAQIEKSIDTSDFLKRYRDAVPAIEKSLYRNRHIKVDISYYSPETDGNVSKEIEFIEFKSNHDRFILHHHHSDKSFGVQLFRPDHVFSLNKAGDRKYKLVADREVPENASEQLVESPWWIHPSCTTNEGLGHGITEYELNWYSVLTAGDVPITRVVETSVNGRQVFRVDTGKAKQWKNVGMSLYFATDSFIVCNAKYKNPIDSQPEFSAEFVLDYDMVPGDYSSLVIKNYKRHAAYANPKIDRFLRVEHRFSVFKTATHPPETFRLEQFGLPDVAERPRATSRRSLGFIVAGALLGGFLLVAWRRKRHVPTPA